VPVLRTVADLTVVTGAVEVFADGLE